MTTQPWIIQRKTAGRGQKDSACEAVFAGRVRLESYSDRAQRQWGFNAGALLEEALLRQRLFIESLHPMVAFDQATMDTAQQQPTIALRVVHDPSRPNLQIAILGRSSAVTPEDAQVAVLELWHEVRAVFPYDYTIEPAESAEDFNLAAGTSLLAEASAKAGFAEIAPYEGVLVGQNRAYLLGHWRPIPTANEQIWRSLAASPFPAALNVSLQPTTLAEVERVVLAEMAEVGRQLADDKRLKPLHHEAEWAASAHADRLTQLRFPYLVQLHLLAHTVPAHLVRAVGSALVHGGASGADRAGYQASKPSTSEQGETIRCGLSWLEPVLGPSTASDARVARLRYLMDAQEASAVFRLPFPHKGGIPGVTFDMVPTDQEG